MAYTPTAPPAIDNSDAAVTMDLLTEILRYFSEEFLKISQNMNEMDVVDLRVTKKAPLRPRNGMLVEADGTSWNPGAGAGLYVYRASAWVRIG